MVTQHNYQISQNIKFLTQMKIIGIIQSIPDELKEFLIEAF